MTDPKTQQYCATALEFLEAGQTSKAITLLGGFIFIERGVNCFIQRPDENQTVDRWADQLRTIYGQRNDAYYVARVLQLAGLGDRPVCDRDETRDQEAS